MRTQQITGQVMRLTKVDRCGRVVPGPASSILTEGFVSVTSTPNVAEGEEKRVTKANGKTCASRRSNDSISSFGLAFQLCAVDPDLAAFINPEWPLIMNNRGETAGFEIGEDIPNGPGVAVELWTEVDGGDACDNPDAAGSWGYWLWPWATSFRLGEWEHGADYLNLTFTGTVKNRSRWGKGPWPVVLNGTSSPTPGPLLVAVGAKNFVHHQVTEVAPPVELPGVWGVSAATGPDFDLAADGTDPDGLTATLTVAAGLVGTSHRVDWGDGTAVETIAATDTDHTYAEAGAYQVSVYPIADPDAASYQYLLLPF